MKLFTPLFILFAFKVTAQPDRNIRVTDMLRIKTVSAITISMDGSKAAFVVTSIEPDDTKTDYRYVSQIFTINTNGSGIKQITFSKEGSSAPSWSPDGRQLAFTRTVDTKSQVFVIPVDGGEAKQLTKSRAGAFFPKWSPDGKKILYSSPVTLADLVKDSVLNPSHSLPVWSVEKPGFSKNENLKLSNVKPDPDGNMEQIRAYLAKDEVDKKARVINKLNFQDEMNVTGDINFTQYFITDVKDSAKPELITKGFYRFNNVDFFPDGKLLLSGYVDSFQSPDRALENQLLTANADGSGMKLLIGKPKMIYNGAVLSPSGKKIAFNAGSTAFVNVPQLQVMDVSNPSNIITIPFDRNKNSITWSSDEKYIYFTAQSNGGQPLYRVDLDTKKAEQLTDFNSGVTSYDVSRNFIVFAKTQVTDPSDLYISDPQVKNIKQYSSFNAWVSQKQLSIPEKKTFVNDKGLTVEYWVMKPSNFTRGKKYPLLLEIHGGPTAMWGPGEASMWHEFQYFCSKGYGVVYCNPRGSGGYGEKFLQANIKDWGTGPTSDVLTALDKTIEEGWADTSKLLVTGGSYAGYLVAWIIAHDHRFKAACSQRGVYDLATFFGEGNAWQLVPNYFGGYPWEPEVNATLIRESPITYVKNITTPYIIFHGDNDRRTGFVQGEMLYRSLKVLGRPVEYVRHPGATHEITRSGDNRQRIDQMLRTYEFFQRYIGK